MEFYYSHGQEELPVTTLNFCIFHPDVYPTHPSIAVLTAQSPFHQLSLAILKKLNLLLTLLPYYFSS